MSDKEAVDLFLRWADGDKEAEKTWDSMPVRRGPHGKLAGVQQEAYGDTFVYEDGHVEYESIGD